jgi:Raf kinase inhibitor-like YbhB/YbcL family protein
MKISSPAFKDGGVIPFKYSCEGGNINPEIDIDKVPEEARSLVLIVDDPDAPGGIWTHWILYNIPADTTKIAENSAPGKQGISTSRQKGYIGPCPPGKETHRYFFRLYALDTDLEESDGLTREKIDKKIKGHVVGTAEMMGYYSAE